MTLIPVNEPITKEGVDPHGNWKRSPEGRRLMLKSNWVEGWWDNLSNEPIYIRDKYHLKEVCQRLSKQTGRTIIPRAFAKPSSQGKGIEWNF